MLELQVLHGLIISFQPTNEQVSQRKVGLSGNDVMKEMKSLVLEILKAYLVTKELSPPKREIFHKCRYYVM